MATSTALRPAVRAAFTALIDYAGLFPPAKFSLGEARDEYRDACRGPHAWILGRFIVPATLLASNVLDETLSAIVEPNADAFAQLAAARKAGAKIDSLEIPLEKSLTPFRDALSRDEILNILGAIEADLTVADLRGIPAFVEVPRRPPWRGMLGETMWALTRLRLGAKIRCGGVTGEAFPSVDEVGAFIAAACQNGVPFKATAGLHHPVRHVDAATGFVMHGFLNILAATALAPSVPTEMLGEILAEEDASAFRFEDEACWWRDRRIGLERLQQTRREAFVAYGSCSFQEPVEDLAALRILPS